MYKWFKCHKPPWGFYCCCCNRLTWYSPKNVSYKVSTSVLQCRGISILSQTTLLLACLLQAIVLCLVFWGASLIENRGKGKGKGSPWQFFFQSCLTLGGGAHPRFQAIEPAFVRRQSYVVTWPVRLRHETLLPSHRSGPYLSTCIFMLSNR